MSTLYLHIGMHKTGSTSIQAAFANGREQLAKHGVGYFRLEQNHSGVLRGMFGDVDERGLPPMIAEQLGVGPNSSSFDRAALLRLFDRALAADRMPKLVMSGEGLFQFKREHVARMEEHLSRFFDDMRIIVYVRDPVSWASSFAQTAIQKMWNREWTLDKPCDPEAIAAKTSKIVPQYRAGIEPYIEAFGRKAVDIRVFDRSRLVNGELIADFCTAIGEPGLASILSGSVMNPSLSYEAALLMDLHKRRLAASDSQRADFAREFNRFRKRLEGLEGTRFVLPKETLERVWAAVADDLAWLREVVDEEVFGEASYPPEATTGPAWSEITLRQLVEVIEGGAVPSTAPVKRDRQKIREAVEAVVQGVDAFQRDSDRRST